MPDTLQAPSQDTPKSNPYDLGDTERQDLRTTEEPPAPAPQPPAQPAADATQGRRPDGTFAAKHPNSLIQAAQTLGYSDDEISDFTTPQLSAVVVRALQQQANDRVANGRQQDALNNDARNPPQPPEPEAPPFDLSEEEFDPRIVQRLKTQHDEMAQLKRQLAESQRREQSRTFNTTRAMLDEAFESLGATDETIFGKGGVGELSDDERARRNAVVNAAYPPVPDGKGGFRANPGLAEDTPRLVARNIKAARQRLYPAAPAAAAAPGYDAEQPGKNGAARNGKPAPTVEDWNAGGLTRPAQRQIDDLPPGDEKARRTVARHLKQNPKLLGGDEELDAFPE